MCVIDCYSAQVHKSDANVHLHDQWYEVDGVIKFVLIITWLIKFFLMITWSGGWIVEHTL